MKAIVCEMCGSNDLIKQEGVFVCQSCGTKYSVEEAKRLMIDGAVKIDDTDEIKNLYEIARRAKSVGDDEKAAKHYEMILIKAPSDWEANFYSALCKAKSSKKEDVANYANVMTKWLHTSLEMIKENVDDLEKKQLILKETWNEVKELQDYLVRFIASCAQSFSTDEYFNIIGKIGQLCHSYLDELITVFKNDQTIMSTVGIELLKDWVSQGINKEYAIKYSHEIKKYDDNYTLPPSYTTTTTSTSYNAKSLNSASSGGCYVATCVYGSYDCPQVWTLRRFRDHTLAETIFGRAFIHTYYAVSPTLVKWFGNTSWFKKMWKATLDKMVSKLQEKGFEDTPYKDKNWK